MEWGKGKILYEAVALMFSIAAAAVAVSLETLVARSVSGRIRGKGRFVSVVMQFGLRTKKLF